jgi:hypothetical protein
MDAVCRSPTVTRTRCTARLPFTWWVPSWSGLWTLPFLSDDLSRLHGEIAEHGYVTPAEFEAAYYRQSVSATQAGTL